MSEFPTAAARPEAPKGISSLDEPYEAGRGEQEPLLGQQHQVIVVNDDDSDDDFEEIDYPRPYALVLLYHLTGLLLFTHLVFLLLILLSITSPFFARNTLPPHFGSSFLPLWLTFLGVVALSLVRFSFSSIPLGLESDDLNIVTHFTGATCAFIQLIVILSVGPLRHRENVLTLVILGLSVASGFVAIADTLCVVKYRETPLFPKTTRSLGAIVPEETEPLPVASRDTSSRPHSYGTIPTDEHPILTRSKHVGKHIVSLVGVSLPLALLHLALIAATVLLFLNTILTAYDASLQPEDGHLWRVNPWRIKFDEGGRWTDTNRFGLPGRPYRVHLYCKGVNNDVDDFSLATDSSSTQVDLLTGEGHSINNGISDKNNNKEHDTYGTTLIKSHGSESLIPKIHRTILVESDRGVTGHSAGAWVKSLLRSGKLTDGDVQVRVCYWDRPGYGFSDNSPSSSIPHVTRALTQALSLSGELARIDVGDNIQGGEEAYDSPSRNTSSTPQMAPSPFARSGFILVGDTYGALHSALFAALRPRYIHSVLYLSPLSPTLYFSHDARGFRSFFSRLFRRLRFDATAGPKALFSELGIYRWLSVFRNESRERRVHAAASDLIRPEIERAWLEEEKERHNIKSESAVVWENAQPRYPERPTIILSQNSSTTPSHLQKWRKHGYSQIEWEKHERAFVEDIIGSNVLDWHKDWDGNLTGSLPEKALKKLVKLDVRV